MQLKYKAWNQVPIKIFNEIANIYDQNITELEKDISTLSLLTSTTEDDLYDMTIADLQSLLSQIEWIKDFKIDRNRKFKTIILNGHSYSVTQEMRKMTTSQYIDFQTLYSKKDMRTYLSSILAVILVPKNHIYAKDYEVEDVIKEIEDCLDIQTAQEILFFFLISSITSIDNMLASLCRPIMKMKMSNKSKILLTEKLIQMRQATLDGLLS